MTDTDFIETAKLACPPCLSTLTNIIYNAYQNLRRRKGKFLIRGLFGLDAGDHYPSIEAGKFIQRGDHRWLERMEKNGVSDVATARIAGHGLEDYDFRALSSKSIQNQLK